MNWELVKSCTAPIFNLNGDTKGNGFFISSEGHLLTCAHVVEVPGGWENLRVNGQPVSSIYLGNRSSNDFAVLQVAGYQGKAAPISLQYKLLNRFLTVDYGRPEFPLGTSIDGTITDVNTQSDFGDLPMLRLRIKANLQQVQTGFSGSPVFDTENQSVVGIIAAYDNTEGALALPLTTVLEKWPPLNHLLRPSSALNAMETPSEKAKIFISYRSEDPDLSLAQHFYEALKSAGHETFMAGESLRLGDEWPHHIDLALEQCDYFLLLLSPKSAVSDMVTEEVKRAKYLRDSRPNGKPRILPVRVNFPFSKPLNYDLRGYLSRIQQRLWNTPSDTAVILQEILNLVSANEAPPPVLPRPAQISGTSTIDSPPLPIAEPEWPEGQVPYDSRFYVSRPPIEDDCYREIDKPFALIRIKAPRQMGKTSLMARILNHAREECISSQISLQLVDGSIFMDLNKLLRWFCLSVGRRLQLSNRVPELWDEANFTAKENCTDYFEQHLLRSARKPLALAIDEADRLFEYPQIAAEFFGLLRGWHEMGKNNDTWKKFRLVVVHSTECYVTMDVNQSPFNVGFPVRLPAFSPEQVLLLARKHSLTLTENEVERLMNLVSGHPYLVRVALYFIARQELTFEQFTQTAHTEAGKYSDHLRRHLWNLEQNPTLATAMKSVVASNEPVRLDAEEAFKLEGMGLVKRQGNDVTISCELYKLYLSDRFRVNT